jgi:hypothetical protein
MASTHSRALVDDILNRYLGAFMIQHRRVLVPVFLGSFAALLVLIPSGSVEARTKATSAPVAKQIFDGRSLPSESELASMMGMPQDTPLPEGKGKDLTQLKCNKCHASRVWVKKHYTQDQWSSVMDQMVEKGMEASDDEIEIMTNYLTTNFGPVKKDAPPPQQ